METVETVETVSDVESVCDHPRLTYTRSVLKTNTTDTASLKVSDWHCPDCGTRFVSIGPNGASSFAVLPLVSVERASAIPKPAKTTKQPVAPAPAATPEQRVAAAEAKIIADIGGDGPGTRLAVGFFRKGYHKSCQACTALAKQMNEWGGAGCRERLDEIVEDILPRAKQWVSDTHKFTKGVLGLVGAVVDVETPLLKTGIRASVVEALDEWDASQKGNDQ